MDFQSYSTIKGLAVRNKIDAMLRAKIELFNVFIAEPLKLKYTVKLVNETSPTASIIFDFTFNRLDASLQWQGDSIILHSNNQNRVIKDALISPQWVAISLLTMSY
jgi:hypothetical protein